MKNILRAALAVTILGTFGACSTGSGKLVGFVVDGVTGLRIDMFEGEDMKNVDDNDDAPNQVFAIIDGAFVTASPCDEGEANADNGISLQGCYIIEGIPAGQEIPVFAQHDKYEWFQSRVTLNELGGTDSEAGEAGQDVGNIRLFPKGYVASHAVAVSINGTPAANAAVHCQLSSIAGNTLAIEGSDWLVPQSTTTAAHTGQTDADGIFALDSTKLVLGAEYKCEAISQPIGNQVYSGDIDLIVGVSPSVVYAKISQAAPAINTEPIFALRSNVDDPGDVHGKDGVLTITMNRPVELVPLTLDCQDANLSVPDYDGDGKPPATLRTAEPGNKQSESVNAVVEGDAVKLSFKGVQNTIDEDDIGAQVTYSGIFIRAVSTDDRSDVRRIGGPGVPAGSCGAWNGAPGLQNARTGGTQSATMRLF